MNKQYLLIGGVLVVLAIGGFLLLSNKPQTQTAPEVVTQPQVTAQPEGTAASNATGSSMEEGMVEFSVEGGNLKYTPNQLKVKKGDKVKITFKSTAGAHDFVIDEFNVKTAVLSSGKEEVVEFVADKSGTFEFYCSVPGHRAAGMKGTLTVE